MKTTTVQSHAGKIACYQSSGSGRTIVLVHGNSASAKAFARQLDETLGARHRVIAFDLPGHGASDDAADPTIYGMTGYAGVLMDVVRHFGIDNAVFAGWSLGGHIVLQAAPDLPHAKGFVIFGTPPLGSPPAMDRAFLPHPAMAFTFARDLNAEQARAYVAAAFRPGGTELPPTMIADVLRTDGRARAQLVVPSTIPPRDQIAVVANLKQPLAVLHGAQEQLINGAYFADLTMPTLWRGRVQMIENAGHLPQWEQPETFNMLLDAFVREVA